MTSTSLLYVAFAFALFAAPVLAQDGTTVAVGSSLPGAADGTFQLADGSSATLRSLMGESGLVVVFWSNVCPWTERYADRLAILARDYQPAGVRFVAVNSNDSTRFPEEDVASMRRVAAQNGFDFPYLVDDGSLARALGARNTPQVYFFGMDTVLKYMGAIDSSPADPSRVETPYLKNAMDQHLAGQAIEVRQTNALGCTIKTP